MFDWLVVDHVLHEMCVLDDLEDVLNVHHGMFD
jgi:hypothetical protein